MGKGRQTTVGLSIFSVFAGYFFGNFRDKVSIITVYTVCRRLFSDPKMHDLK